MVRFNFFIDILRKKIYYKQIEKPVHIFDRQNYELVGGYSASTDSDFNLVIDSIGEKFAHCAGAKAGLKSGDTIIWFCGYSMKEITEKLIDFRDVLHNYDCYHLKVKRNGDTLDLKTYKNY